MKVGISRTMGVMQDRNGPFSGGVGIDGFLPPRGSFGIALPSGSRCGNP